MRSQYLRWPALPLFWRATEPAIGARVWLEGNASAPSEGACRQADVTNLALARGVAPRAIDRLRRGGRDQEVLEHDRVVLADAAEETGPQAGEFVHRGRRYGADGSCAQGFDVFLATAGIVGEPARDESARDMVQRVLTDAELVGLIRAGGCFDAASVAAYAPVVLHESFKHP